MKAYLINMHLLAPRSRSSAKVKVKYKGYISQKWPFWLHSCFTNTSCFEIIKFYLLLNWKSPKLADKGLGVTLPSYIGPSFGSLTTNVVHFSSQSLAFNPLPNNKFLNWSKFKELADDKINLTEKLKFVLERAEIIVRKGENAGYQHFLLFQQCFDWLVVLGFNATLTAMVISWRSVTHMCFLALSHQY